MPGIKFGIKNYFAVLSMLSCTSTWHLRAKEMVYICNLNQTLLFFVVVETYAKLKMTANYSRSNGQRKIKLDGPNGEKFLEDIEVYTYTCS